jgi:hypothetical protein
VPWQGSSFNGAVRRFALCHAAQDGLAQSLFNTARVVNCAAAVGRKQPFTVRSRRLVDFDGGEPLIGEGGQDANYAPCRFVA